jgi:hypothetical protein
MGEDEEYYFHLPIFKKKGKKAQEREKTVVGNIGFGITCSAYRLQSNL